MKRSGGRSDRVCASSIEIAKASRRATRENCRQWWIAVASGRTSEDAAVDFRVAGGRSTLVPEGGRRATNTFLAVVKTTGALSFVRRTRRDGLLARTWSGSASHRLARDRARRPIKLTSVGPKIVWKGRRAVHRQARRWATAWSPEQIGRRLRFDFPEDKAMRIIHEAIYQAWYVQARGALHRELPACLRTGRTLRMPRPVRADNAGASSLSQPPPSVPWWSARHLTMLLHLPRMTGHAHEVRVKKGPALAGHGAKGRTRCDHSRDHLA